MLPRSSAPCFVWEPDEAWVSGKAAFAMDDAVAYYENGDASIDPARGLPWFWVDERRGRAYVDEARGPPNARTLRRKNATREDVFVVGDASHRVFVRDVHFYGTACCGSGPSTKSLVSRDLRVSGSRFLYAPPTGVRTSTLTLSVSMTTTTSSTATPSPTCAVHSTTVPSVMESPMLGTGTSSTLSNRANRPSAGCCGFWVRASEKCREAWLTAAGLAARRLAPRARCTARKSMLQE